MRGINRLWSALATCGLCATVVDTAHATALQFAGDGDRVNIALPALFGDISSNDFTFTGRVRVDAVNTTRVFYAQQDGSNFATMLVGANGLYFYVNANGATHSLTVNSPQAIGAWQHFGARWNAATQQVSLIVDGVAAAAVGGTSSSGTNGVFTLGTRSDGVQALNGAIDEFALWPAALSDAQIAANRTGLCLSGVAPVLSYDFQVGLADGNNTGLTTLPDTSGNGANGTLNGFALSGTTSNWITSPYNGGCISSADLSIALAAAPNPVAAGGTVTWTAHLTNPGPPSADSVVVHGEVPSGSSFVSLSAPPAFSCTTPVVGASGALTCSAGTLAAGAYDFVLSTQADAGDAPNSTLTANWSVTSSADTNAANDNAAASTTLANVVVLQNDAASTSFNVALTNIDVLANDGVAVGGAALDANSLVVSVPAAHGNASCSGTCSYTPAAGYTGIDTFTYRVCDSSATPVCGTASVRVAIAPHAVGDRFVTVQDTPLSASVAGNDIVALNSVFAKVADPAAGAATVAANGSVIYTPTAGYNGGDTFLYKVCLPAPDDIVCDFTTVDLTVLQPNDRIFYDGFGM